MSLDTQTKLAARLITELTRLGSAGWDKANHHAFMFLMDLSAGNKISAEALTRYIEDYHEQVDSVYWLNKDIEALAIAFSEKLSAYQENPTEETALTLIK